MSRDPQRMTVSHRDHEALAADLGRWIADRLDGARITSIDRPTGNGLSSETILLDVETNGATQSLVARVEPAASDVPVFESYDLGMQAQVMRLLGERSDVPVPKVRWEEPAANAIGAPFFVMDRITGRVPADNPPYTFEGWLLDAAPEDRRSLQDDSVWTLAGIHGADVTAADIAFLHYDLPGASALHRHVEWWRRYHRWVSGSAAIPVIDDAFAWIERNWPADDGGPDVISWGDARIGNMLFDGFRPAGVLDWEMAAVGPRGVDVGWMSFIHLFFQDIAELMELPGIPGFFQPDDVAQTYALRSGVELDLSFWLVYAALRYAIVLVRVNQRMVAFGEARPSGDPSSAIMFENLFRQLMR